MVRVNHEMLLAGMRGSTPRGGPIVRSIAAAQLVLCAVCALLALSPSHLAVNPAHELGFLAGFAAFYFLAWWSAMLYWKAMLLCAALQAFGFVVSFIVEGAPEHRWKVSLVGSLAGLASVALCLAGAASTALEEYRDRRVLRRAAKLARGRRRR